MNKWSTLLVALVLAGPCFAEATLESSKIPVQSAGHPKAMHESHRPRKARLHRHAPAKPAGVKVSRTHGPDFPWVTPS